MSRLFDPYTLKNHKIKNRVVLPPMVCFGWTDESGFVSDRHVKHYEKIAESGTGLMIVEATCINKDGRLSDTQLGIWSDEHVEGLNKIAAACHKHGAVVLIQIHHAGFMTPKTVAALSVAPSDTVSDKFNARALTIPELKAIQQDFIMAAQRAEKAGFDGIELHGAHSYLINQFMSPVANRRTDEYGTDFSGRSRFAVEIIKGIKEVVGKDFIIDYRMGGNEPLLEEGIEVAKVLEKAGVDMLHVSSGIRSEVTPVAPDGFPYHWIVYNGTEIKKQVNVPVIVVFDIRTPERAAYLVDNGMSDFVAIGKSQLADHNWTRHAMEQVSVISCLKCPKCAWYWDGEKCPRYEL
ncbi:MAG TPA: NADH:flavin oxidoreductase [Clostridia bacterium]|nr:NADH:flavin oxidoreductase [Clostridia bacterium]